MAVDSLDVKIVPTITTNDPAELSKYFTLYPQFAKRIQLDIVDGSFVPTTTVPLANIQSLPENAEVDIHLMAVRPSEHLQHILRLKPHLCILHAEAGENLLPIFEQLKAAGIRTGVAILQQTYPGDVRAYVQAVNHTLIFAGALGKQGGTANLLQVEKVKLVRSMNPGVEIGWDGGANLENVRALAHSDINIIDVGSFIAKAEDPAKAYQALVEEKSQRGVAL